MKISKLIIFSQIQLISNLKAIPKLDSLRDFLLTNKCYLEDNKLENFII